MAPLVWIAAHVRAVLAPHAAFKLMNGRCLWSPDDIERDRLVRVAAQASHFEIAKPGVDRVAQRRGWLRRTPKAEHALVPRVTRKTVSFPASFRRQLCRRPDR